jgi:plastocyanin
VRIRATLVATATLGTLTVLVGCAEDPDATKTPTAAASPSNETPPARTPEQGQTKSSEAPPEPVVITIEEFAYSGLGPVASGTEITVKNTDAEVHTVTAEDPGDFDLTVLPGKSARLIAPSRPGRYPYLCSFHAGMTGILVVK